MSSSEATPSSLIAEFIRHSTERDSKLDHALKQLETLVLNVPASKTTESSNSKDTNSCDCVYKFTDLTNLSTFKGFGSQSAARNWLVNVDLEREKHNWTEAFTLQVARSLLTENAAVWAEIDSDKLINWYQFKIEFRNKYCGKPKRTNDKPLVSVECMAKSLCQWEDSTVESNKSSVSSVDVTIEEFTDYYYKVRSDRVERKNQEKEKKRVKREKRIAREAKNMKATIDENKKKTDN